MSATYGPGLAIAAAVAIAAQLVHALPFAPFTIGDRHPIEPMLIAIVIGALVRNLVGLPRAARDGVRFAVHGVLPAAIVLIGVRLDFRLLLDATVRGLAINLICVAVALLGTVWLAFRLGASRKLGLLVGVGTAICGGTAIAVTAPVVEANESETAFSIAAINVLGLLWMIVFPAAGALLGLTQGEFGVWAGSSIHATAQVVAAGFAYGTEAAEIAVVVKLVRVLLLAPCVVLIGLWYGRMRRRGRQPYVDKPFSITTLVPPFILGFVAVASLQSLDLLPSVTLHLQESVAWGAGDVTLSAERLLTIVAGFLASVAMAGVGLGVHVTGLLRIGGRPLAIGLLAATLLAPLSLLLVKAIL